MRPVAVDSARQRRRSASSRRLVALFGGLGEELHHNRRERLRNASDVFARRHCLPRDMAVDPLHRISGREGQLPRQHFVKGDTECIEIAAGVHRAIHPAGLFRRHVRERPGDHLGRGGRLALARQKRSNAEPRQPRAAVCSIHQDIRRLDVLMNETSLMHAAQRPRQTDRDVQKMRYLQRSAQQQSIERRSAGILEHQRPAAVIVRQRDRPERPGSIKFGLERVFVFKPLGRGPFRGNEQDRRQAVAGPTVESDVSLSQRRKYVARELVHESLLQRRLL
jgi:hypothetical protein